MRIRRAKKNDWEFEDVMFVVKNLKKKKARDPLGHLNELFQMGGSDLTCAVLKCMNRSTVIFHNVCKSTI